MQAFNKKLSWFLQYLTKTKEFVVNYLSILPSLQSKQYSASSNPCIWSILPRCPVPFTMRRIGGSPLLSTAALPKHQGHRGLSEKCIHSSFLIFGIFIIILDKTKGATILLSCSLRWVCDFVITFCIFLGIHLFGNIHTHLDSRGLYQISTLLRLYFQRMSTVISCP